MTTPRKPRDDELDVFGLTNRGRVRATNEDQFLLASIYKRVHVHATSLPENHGLPLGEERLAYIAMVADGVGGLEGGERASATALDVTLRYVTEGMKCYLNSEVTEAQFIDELQRAALRAHEAVVKMRATEHKRSATTLTLYMGVWPFYYVLQVGDSRYYVWQHDTLTQVSRDQTLAEELVERGILTRAAAAKTPLSNILASAIGGDQAAPVVTRLRSEWNMAHLMCSDGLTKHVSDEQIAHRLRTMTSARETCELLLQDALDGGGTDNITIIVGRAVERPQ